MGSPLATSEGMVDLITNEWRPKPKKEEGKTVVIDIRHLKVSSIQVGKGTAVLKLSIEILSHPTPFIFVSVRIA